MKKLSYWGARNPWKARIIIIIGHFLILYLGWYIGSALNQMNILLPGLLLFVFVACYFGSVILYPRKKEKQKLGKRWYYMRQKICDFSLAAFAWAMIICIANNKNVQLGFFNQVSASSIEATISKKEKPTAAEILESLKYRDKSTLTKTEKRILKKEFNVQIKKYVVAKLKGDHAAADNSVSIILAIIAALGLLVLLSGLACNLSCNGNDGAAVIVALLGTAGIIIGLVFVIRGIQRKSKRETKNAGG